jgi:hypothetical protein
VPVQKVYRAWKKGAMNKLRRNSLEKERKKGVVL